ncbi:hypothetical protein ACFLTI_08020 [Bacteroidota bacterium]
MKIRYNIKHAIISVLFILFIIMVFFSNKTLIILFRDKIWAHKVNSIEKLNEASNILAGVELDVMFYEDKNYFDVNHPPDRSINLTLSEYFESQLSNINCKYWIDYKNLNIGNKTQSSNSLDSIINLNKINKNKVIVESSNPQLLETFVKKGFITSYYLPINLYKLNKEELETAIEKIKENITSFKHKYISADYKNYPILKKHFPDKKKNFWFITYSSMNKIKARILFYKILLDKNTDILLIPFRYKNDNN